MVPKYSSHSWKQNDDDDFPHEFFLQFILMLIFRFCCWNYAVSTAGYRQWWRIVQVCVSTLCCCVCIVLRISISCYIIILGCIAWHASITVLQLRKGIQKGIHSMFLYRGLQSHVASKCSWYGHPYWAKGLIWMYWPSPWPVSAIGAHLLPTQHNGSYGFERGKVVK